MAADFVVFLNRKNNNIQFNSTLTSGIYDGRLQDTNKVRARDQWIPHWKTKGQRIHGRARICHEWREARAWKPVSVTSVSWLSMDVLFVSAKR